MFCKLDFPRKSIVTLALSQDNRETVIRYCVIRAAPGFCLVELIACVLCVNTQDEADIRGSQTSIRAAYVR